MPRNRVALPIEWRVDHHRGGQPPTRPDLRVAELAARRHGVIAHDEALACGLTPRQIERRIEAGRLHPKYRGVYAVGHPGLSLPGRFLAGVLAAGGHSALSHAAGAAHLGLEEWDERRIVEVTSLGPTRGEHARLYVHRTARLDPIDVWTVQGIPVTSPARTIADLSGRLGPKPLRRLIREALVRKLVTYRELVEALERLRPFRGAGKLARLLATEPAPTRSELEDIVLDLILGAGFVPPDVNVPVWIRQRRVIPDFRWPAQRLIVEADGAAYHDDPLSRAADAERQALLEAAGERVLRVRWKQAIGRRTETVARLAAAGAPRVGG